MTHTHAYLAILAGKCQAATVDTSDARTASDVAGLIREGRTIERVTIEVARRALFEVWPMGAAIAAGAQQQENTHGL